VGREDIFTNDSNEKNNDEDFIPMSFALAKAIHGQESNRNMLVLFDPGSTLTWISSNTIPEGTKGDEEPSLIGMTIARQFNSNKTGTYKSLFSRVLQNTIVLFIQGKSV
jgi:hypothetical protein